jgi:hypothetical protein
MLGLTVTNSHAGLSEDMQDGHHVLLMRHADAPGFGDPPGYKLQARLIDKGPVSVEPSLGSFFDDMSLGQAQTKDMQKMIATRFAENKSTPLILVTHHVNIEAYTGKIVNVGDMVLVRVRPDGSYVSHQVYPSPKANS